MIDSDFGEIALNGRMIHVFLVLLRGKKKRKEKASEIF